MMIDIEHPDITYVNRTGYTREQWWEMKMAAEENCERELDERED